MKVDFLTVIKLPGFWENTFTFWQISFLLHFLIQIEHVLLLILIITLTGLPWSKYTGVLIGRNISAPSSYTNYLKFTEPHINLSLCLSSYRVKNIVIRERTAAATSPGAALGLSLHDIPITHTVTSSPSNQ